LRPRRCSPPKAKQAARVVMDVIGKYEVKRDLVPTSGALLTPEVQKAFWRK
jgi:type III restriction enzyme